jgi:hypothetical protein
VKRAYCFQVNVHPAGQKTKSRKIQVIVPDSSGEMIFGAAKKACQEMIRVEAEAGEAEATFSDDDFRITEVKQMVDMVFYVDERVFDG